MSEPTYHAPDLDLLGAEHVRRYPETGGDLWRIMTDMWLNYDASQARTDRTIPLVVLSPA